MGECACGPGPETGADSKWSQTGSLSQWEGRQGARTARAVREGRGLVPAEGDSREDGHRLGREGAAHTTRVPLLDGTHRQLTSDMPDNLG